MQNVTMLGMVLLDRTAEESLATASRFLRSSALDLVTYVDYDTLLRADSDEAVRDLLLKSAITLWADKEILEFAGIESESRLKEISERFVLHNLIRNSIDSEGQIILAGTNAESLDNLKEELLSFEPKLDIVHQVVIENPGSSIPEATINELNSYAPALIISRMDYHLLMNWLNQSRTMINAGIWLSLPEHMSIISTKEKSILQKIRRCIRYAILRRRTEK